MLRFARHYRVFFFEEPVFEEDLHAPRLETREVSGELTVCVPHLPSELRPVLAGDSSVEVDAELRSLLRGFVAQRRIRPTVTWLYTPMALPVARELDSRLLVYDCMDELSAFLNAPPRIIERERELMQEADLVFTGGHTLYERKRHQHPIVHAFPSSVDASHFARARGSLPEPADQAEIARPRLGYFGVVDERIDLQLLEKVAFAHPEWQLVMVGPVVKIDERSLPHAPNIHWLGGKSYDELPRYIAHWDVALMPFALNEATRYISPTKTLEYLAAGRPVVSTAIADVVHPYGQQELVGIADHASFAHAIEHALAQGLDLAKSDAMLAATSWDHTWARMHALMERAAPRRQAATIAAAAPQAGGLHV